MGKGLHRFLQKNRNKGIPNVMLYLSIINAVLCLYSYFTQNAVIYATLRFNMSEILRGQVWRCFTWILTYGMSAYSGGGLGLLYLVFYILFHKWLGEVLEAVWGPFRVNIYYFGGVLLTAVAAVIFGLIWKIPVLVDAYYMNISLMLAVATLIPEERIMLFGIFPLKMRWLAILDIALILLSLYTNVRPYSGEALWMVFLIYGTAPVISLVNYVLHFGKDVGRLFPVKRSLHQKKRQIEFKRATRPNPDWAKNYRSKTGEQPYRHKCTVCGRTDRTDPNLEFRYCSRCKGYFCYCVDHINQHTHIE